MVDFHFSLQRVNNENNRRRLGRAELGKLWSWRGDQPEIEGALGADSSVSYSDNPLVLLASFAGQRFWVRTVHNYQEMGDTASWVLRRLRGQEAASRGQMVTSAWSRYSTVQYSTVQYSTVQYSTVPGGGQQGGDGDLGLVTIKQV